MPDVNPAHLLDRAGRTEGGAGRPRQADLRRGISDAYYAMFHALTSAVGAQILRNCPAPAVAAFRRTLGHGPVRATCEMLTSGAAPLPSPQVLAFAAVADPDVRLVAQSFVGLQEERHLADYAHNDAFDLVRLNDAISVARRSIAIINARANHPPFASFLTLLAIGSSWTS